MTRILVYSASTLSSVNPLVGGVGLGEGEGLSSESVSIDRVTHLAISSAPSGLRVGFNVSFNVSVSVRRKP